MTAPRRTGKPKIYLVQPKFPPSYWGLEHFLALTPYQAVFPPLGLLTLAALNEAGSAAVNALAERLDVERTAMGKMAGFLERDGLIRIRRSPTDGRSRLIELTDKGRHRLAEALPLWREAQRQFEQLNGAKNVTELRQRLQKMVVGDLPAGSSED